MTVNGWGHAQPILGAAGKSGDVSAGYSNVVADNMDVSNGSNVVNVDSGDTRLVNEGSVEKTSSGEDLSSRFKVPSISSREIAQAALMAGLLARRKAKKDKESSEDGASKSGDNDNLLKD